MNYAPKTFVRRWIRQNLGAGSNILWPLFLYLLKTRLPHLKLLEMYEPTLDSYRTSLGEILVIVDYSFLSYHVIADKPSVRSYELYVESRE